MISTQIAKAEEDARKKRAAALAEAEAAAKKKLADEAQALAKAHAEAAAKEKAAAEKRKAEEEKVCSRVQSDGPFTSVVRARVTGLYAGAQKSRRRGQKARGCHRES